MRPTVTLKELKRKLEVSTVDVERDFEMVYKVSKIRRGQEPDDPRGTNAVLFAAGLQIGILLILKI